MDKYLFIDNKMRKFEKEYLIKLGYKLIEIPTSKEVYSEISGHPDIFITKISNTYIIEKSLYDYLKNSKYNNIVKRNSVLCGSCFVKDKYPFDIAYNVCSIGKEVVHNFGYTDKTILDVIDTYKLNKINIKQGYSNCSIAVIDEGSVIVTDKSIANELNKYDIEALYVKCDNIKLLNENNEYSSMHGFIGGCMARLGDKVIVFGDLSYIDKLGVIREYIKSRGLEIKEFIGKDVIDYGGIFEI